MGLIISILVGWFCIVGVYILIDFIFKNKVTNYVILNNYITAFIHILILTSITNLQSTINPIIFIISLIMLLIGGRIIGSIISDKIKLWHLTKQSKKIREKYGDDVVDDILNKYNTFKQKIIKEFEDD